MFNQKKTCFIITPIGDEKDEIRRHIDGVINTIITPIMESDYEIKVAHKLFEAGSINKQIIELIYKSDLVIANLTQTNPNVMYELAFRHTLGKPTIIMAEINTPLPFDVSSERTIFYKNDIQGAKEAQEELKKYLSHIDYDSGQTTGPIHDYLDSTELKKLILSHNQNTNISEILGLMEKRLNNIENSVINIKNDRYLLEANKKMLGNIEFTAYILELIINMVENFNKRDDNIDKKFDEIITWLHVCISYINNNTVQDSASVSVRTLIYRLVACVDILKKHKDDIKNIIYND